MLITGWKNSTGIQHPALNEFCEFEHTVHVGVVPDSVLLCVCGNRFGSDYRATSGNVYHKGQGKLSETGV